MYPVPVRVNFQDYIFFDYISKYQYMLKFMFIQRAHGLRLALIAHSEPEKNTPEKPS